MNARPHHPRRTGAATSIFACPLATRSQRQSGRKTFHSRARYRTTADRGSVAPPAAVDGAEWQPGVTPGADRLRPTLDGEPVPGALAASVTAGWVRVAPLDLLRRPRRGVVRLVPVSRPYR